jgi:hypothetical protein
MRCERCSASTLGTWIPTRIARVTDGLASMIEKVARIARLEDIQQRNRAEKGRDEDSSRPARHNAKSNYAGLAGVFFKER